MNFNFEYESFKKAQKTLTATERKGDLKTNVPTCIHGKIPSLLISMYLLLNKKRNVVIDWQDLMMQ